MKTICCYIFLLSFITASAIDTPEHRISGHLIDTITKDALIFADLILYEKGQEQHIAQTTTNKLGEFVFENIPTGNYTLKVHSMGYDLLMRTNIEVTKSVNLGTLSMIPQNLELEEVAIVASKRQVVYNLDKRVIDASSNLMGDGGTAVDILENTPSIRINAEGEVSFRGSTGFTVYVDGKPSMFSGTQALEQIPAAHIDNIEIVTTPSARHDTGGDVGIINIVTKKQTQQGLRGLVSATGSTLLSYGANFLLNKQSNKHLWSLTGNYNIRRSESDFDQEKTTIVDDLTTTSHSNGPREGIRTNYSLKGGWGYILPKGEIKIELAGGFSDLDRFGDLDYSETRSLAGAPIYSDSNNSIDEFSLQETYGIGSIAFDHRFNENGHEISAKVYYKYGGDALEYFSSDLFNEQGERQQGHRAWEAEHRETWRVNLDYIFPYREGGHLEAGYQYYSYLEDGDYRMDFWDPVKKEFYNREDIYNTFYFQEGVNSIYALVKETFYKFEAQAGVRAEHTHTVLRSSIEGADRLKNRFEFFPSAHLAYSITEQDRLTASFSRRTTRPQLYFMEPYITYRDYYTAAIGNPDVRPEYINSYELNYRKLFKENSINASIFHRYRTDKIERLRIPYEAGVTLDSIVNVGRDYSTGLEVNANIRATRWWNIVLSGNVYDYRVKNDYSAEGKETSSTNYDLRWGNVFEIKKSTRIQLDGNFAGPSVTTQGSNKAYWFVNLAVRQQLMKQKLSISLVFRDIFASARYVSNITTADLQSLTRIKPVYPQISLTLSYSFNNFKTQEARRGSDSELFEGMGH